ncbi:MAG: acetylornithine deacetylase [Lautropia sp.]|nr:acetylornithine deacetylase [Lautropia sp.]
MQDESIDILRTLVGFDTTSQRSNRALIDWVAERLTRQGVEVHVQPGEEAGKFNLFATIGPANVPGIILAGHADAAPVLDEAWETEPFRLINHEGRLYGRGAVDSKGWIACCLAAVPFFQQAALKKPVHLAISYNGETDMKGMVVLSEHLKTLPVLPAAAIVGGPTLMRVVTADKGTAIWRVTVKGKEVHSSHRHEGVSAVEVAARIIHHACGLQKRLEAVRDEAFEYPHTSVHVGRISGGHAANILADQCEFPIEIRALPGEDAGALIDEIQGFCEGLQAEMQAVDPACSIEFKPLRNVPGLTGRHNQALTRMLVALVDDHEPYRTGFGCEGGVLETIGIPTVSCGPGDVKCSHMANESVEISQMVDCLKFLQRLATHLATDKPLDGTPDQAVADLFR